MGLSTRVSWEVFGVTGISSFEIQRAANGGSFATIAYQRAAANLLSYSMIDSSLQIGWQLYRIKALLLNGSSLYSNIVALQNAGPAVIVAAITPNPLSNDAVISIGSAEQCMAGLTVYNMEGLQVMHRIIKLNKGANSLVWSFANLPPGVYYLHIQTGNASSRCRFVKQ